MVRIQDIARAANVSPATVSRCLRKDPTLSINSETGKRIYDIAREMGYRNIKKIETPNEFIVIHKDSHFQDHIDNGYYFAIRNGIEQEVAKNGDTCRFVPMSRLEAEMGKGPATAVLVIGNYPPNEISMIRNLSQTQNIVFVGKMNFLPEGLDTVTYDANECVKIELDQLRNAGIFEFLFVDGKNRYELPLDCCKIHHVRTYLAAHPQMHMAEYIECDGFGSDAGYQAIGSYFQTHHEAPKAIFAATDPLAIGIMKGLSERGFIAGKDTSIVSINGDNSASWAMPSLTTINIHSTVMGCEAVRIARQRMEDPTLPTRWVCFQPTLVEGKSIVH